MPLSEGAHRQQGTLPEATPGVAEHDEGPQAPTSDSLAPTDNSLLDMGTAGSPGNGASENSADTPPQTTRHPQ